jgi:hypothetical protein
LFKIATQGVSLWHFHLYMYCNPNWFISSIFPLSTLVLFFWWFQQVWKFYINSCIEYINHIHLLCFLLLPSPSHTGHPLVWPIFHNTAAFVLGL